MKITFSDSLEPFPFFGGVTTIRMGDTVRYGTVLCNYGNMSDGTKLVEITVVAKRLDNCHRHFI